MRADEKQNLIARAEMPVDSYYYPEKGTIHLPGLEVPECWGIKSSGTNEFVCAPCLTQARAELFSACLNNFILR